MALTQEIVQKKKIKKLAAAKSMSVLLIFTVKEKNKS